MTLIPAGSAWVLTRMSRFVNVGVVLVGWRSLHFNPPVDGYVTQSSQMRVAYIFALCEFPSTGGQSPCSRKDAPNNIFGIGCLGCAPGHHAYTSVPHAFTPDGTPMFVHVHVPSLCVPATVWFHVPGSVVPERHALEI